MTDPTRASRASAPAALDQLETMLDLVRWGASRFAEAGVCLGHGTDDPVDEALALVLHAVHLAPGVPDDLLRARLTREERERAVDLLLRRIEERRPAAYLTRRAWFAGLELYVDERVLVPRSPLAEWIERGFQPWLDPERVERVLDVGTGSGCIAIACAFAFPHAEVDAVDISADALEVASVNIRDHGLAGRMCTLESDLLGMVSGHYDLIVSNPPYVPEDEVDRLPPEHRHEPRVGLAAGADGLAQVHGILAQAPAHLSPRGVLVVEVGASREALLTAYPDLPFVWLDLERGGENVFLLTAAALAP